MWETLHLFSRYAKGYSVSSTSSAENTVSAYTSVNENSDSTTVIIVNRDMAEAQNVTVNLNGLVVNDGSYTTLQLASLPTSETFKSHTNNALKENSVAVVSNSFTISVPALSTTAVLLKSAPTGVNEIQSGLKELNIYPNPASDKLYVQFGSNVNEVVEVTIFDQAGRTIRSTQNYYIENSPLSIDISSISKGIYLLSVKTSNTVSTKSFTVIR
jgi:hypothetical protein